MIAEESYTKQTPETTTCKLKLRMNLSHELELHFVTFICQAKNLPHQAWPGTCHALLLACTTYVLVGAAAVETAQNLTMFFHQSLGTCSIWYSQNTWHGKPPMIPRALFLVSAFGWYSVTSVSMGACGNNLSAMRARRTRWQNSSFSTSQSKKWNRKEQTKPQLRVGRTPMDGPT